MRTEVRVSDNITLEFHDNDGHHIDDYFSLKLKLLDVLSDNYAWELRHTRGGTSPIYEIVNAIKEEKFSDRELGILKDCLSYAKMEFNLASDIINRKLTI